LRWRGSRRRPSPRHRWRRVRANRPLITQFVAPDVISPRWVANTPAESSALPAGYRGRSPPMSGLRWWSEPSPPARGKTELRRR
jgi:hypothetical protein